MDLLVIFKTITAGMDLWKIITLVASGILIKIFADELLYQILKRFWPKEAIRKYILAPAEWFNDKFIERLKKEAPKAGKLFEDDVLEAIDELRKRIAA